MSCLDSSARWKSVTDATPYSLSKPEISSVANPDPGSGIRDPVPFWSLDSGSGIQDRDPGWVKSQDLDPGSGSGMDNPDLISESWETIFCLLKYLNSFMRIRDPGSGMEKIWIRDQRSRMEKIWIQDPGSRMEKNRIRDTGSGINIPDQQNWKSRRQIC